jgi:hypothetical protein
MGRQNMTDKTGQAHRTGRDEHAEKDWQNITARKGLLGQGCQDRTAKTGLPRTGLPGRAGQKGEVSQK